MIDKLNNINLSAKYKYVYYKICVYIYVAYAGLRMSADRDSPDDIFDFVLQQHLLFGLSGWRGESAGRLSQPADS